MSQIADDFVIPENPANTTLTQSEKAKGNTGNIAALSALAVMGLATVGIIWFAYRNKFPWWGWLLALLIVPTVIGRTVWASVLIFTKK